MKTEYVVGIDTSNYTTSCAIVTLDGKLVANEKMPLPVKSGECGLRQSDAVFAHVKNMPVLMEHMSSHMGKSRPVAIAVSERPRNVDGSYMPCFLSGVAVAEGMSTVCGVPLYRFSHQCGHIMAAVYSSGKFELLQRDFVAFHVSGGTTEMLKITPGEHSFKAELLGGTSDLNAGQVIDRIGVRLGLSFPCGRELEALALKNERKIPKKKISGNNFSINLSGLENMAVKLYKETADAQLVASFTLDYIGNALIYLVKEYENRFGMTDFLFAGGVMANAIIKSKLRAVCNASFAEPALSSDNAVGIAVLGANKYNLEK